MIINVPPIVQHHHHLLYNVQPIVEINQFIKTKFYNILNTDLRLESCVYFNRGTDIDIHFNYYIFYSWTRTILALPWKYLTKTVTKKASIGKEKKMKKKKITCFYNVPYVTLNKS